MDEIINKPHNKRVNIFGWCVRRDFLAGSVIVSFTLLAFLFLFTGYFEGGSFVSMLTLGLGTGAILLVWERIEHFTLFGSEIKLRRLTKDAEIMLEGLKESKVALYRTALLLSKRRSGLTNTLRDERSEALIALLKDIEQVGLWECLANEIVSTLDIVIEDAHGSLQDILVADADYPQSVKDVPAYYQSSRSKRFKHEERSESEPSLTTAIEELIELINFREKAAGHNASSDHDMRPDQPK